MWRPLVATSTMTVVVSVFLKVVGQTGSTIGIAIVFALAVSIGVVTYCATVLVLWNIAGRPPGAEHNILNLIKPRIMSLGRAVNGAAREH
jgi:hypothetical protein